MEMQQMLELLLAKIDANQEKAEANQKKAEADRKADKEERKADRKADRAQTQQMMKMLQAYQAKRDAVLPAMKVTETSHRESTAVIKPETTEVQTMACQGMEAHQEEPTSPDRKPEAVEEYEVPAENATVMPVGEPRNKRRRDRKLAAQHRRQRTITSPRENCGPLERLAVTHGRRTHRATVARKMQADRKMRRRATVARRKSDIFRPNTTRRAKVARQMENAVRRNCTMAVIERATQRVGLLRKNLQTRQEGKRGTKIIGGRRPLCQKRKVPTENAIGRCRSGQRSNLGRRGTQKKTPYETVNAKITKRITKFTAGLLPTKNWTPWRGRPPPKRKKGKGLDGRNRW
jgi:hypothetical protein